MVQESVLYFPVPLPLRKSLKVISPRGDFLDMPKKGLTLIEILVSAIILALVMTGLVGIFIGGKRHILHSRSRMTAAELGKYFLEPLQMEVRQDTWSTNCLGGSACPPTTPQTLDNIQYNATYNTSAVAGTTVRRARVSINWTELSPSP